MFVQTDVLTELVFQVHLHLQQIKQMRLQLPIQLLNKIQQLQLSLQQQTQGQLQLLPHQEAVEVVLPQEFLKKQSALKKKL